MIDNAIYWLSRLLVALALLLAMTGLVCFGATCLFIFIVAVLRHFDVVSVCFGSCI